MEKKNKKLRNTERGGGVDAEIEDALGFSYRVRRQIVWVVFAFLNQAEVRCAKKNIDGYDTYRSI